MDPESKKLLQDILSTTEENNKMLHSMRNSMRMARIMSYLYWIFIIGSAVGAYYFIQPYIDQGISTFTGVKGNLENFGKILDSVKGNLPR